MRTAVANIILGQVQNGKFIHGDHFAQLIGEQRSQIHVTKVAFSIDTDLVDAISEPHKLDRIHFDFQIVTFRLVQARDVLFGKDVFAVAENFVNHYVVSEFVTA